MTTEMFDYFLLAIIAYAIVTLVFAYFFIRKLLKINHWLAAKTVSRDVICRRVLRVADEWRKRARNVKRLNDQDSEFLAEIYNSIADEIDKTVGVKT